MADYAFVPGGTSFELAARDYLGYRTSGLLTITADTQAPLTTFKEFITEVAKGQQTNLPVDDLWVASHGLHTGAMTLPLVGKLTGETFEDVSAAAALSGLAIPSEARDPRKVNNGVPIPCVVHIVGCFVGRYDAYMRRLKQGMGEGALGVEAPLMWDGFYEKADGTAILNGALRYMLYDFRVASLTPFTTRNDLLAAFRAQPNRRIDSSVVPDAVFDAGVPKAFSTFGRVKVPFTVALKPKVEGQASVAIHSIYDYWREPVGPFLMPKGPADTSPASEREAFVEGELNTRTEFQDPYPFKYYLRYDLNDLSSFVKGFDWQPGAQPPDDQGRIGWTGFRHLYRCGVPIVDPSNDKNELVYDYVQSGGAVQQLNLSNNPNFFARVFTD